MIKVNGLNGYNRVMLKKGFLITGAAVVFGGLIFSGFWAYRILVLTGGRSARIMQFLNGENRKAFPIIKAGTHCDGYQFTFPSDGYVGFYWDDSFRPFHRHQGIDIFGGEKPGITPVYAASDGFLTRESDWVSSLIVRVPQDPTSADRQIWVYFTHMALPDGTSTIVDKFPKGSNEIPIKTGDLLGYQGNYSGDPLNPVGVHLHISIVKDDGNGHYLNELRIQNTVDPSAYFGMNLNSRNPDSVDGCPTK